MASYIYWSLMLFSPSLYSSMQSQHSQYFCDLKAQQASKQTIQLSLDYSQWMVQRSQALLENSSSQMKYLDACRMSQFSYSYCLDVTAFRIMHSYLRATSKFSLKSWQFAVCRCTSMHFQSMLLPFYRAYMHLTSACGSSIKSVIHISAMLAQAWEMSLLIYAYGVTDLKGFFRWLKASLIPAQKDFIAQTPSQISPSQKYLLQVPFGFYLIDFYRTFFAYFALPFCLSRLAQHITTASLKAFLLYACPQKYYASSQSSYSYFSSAIWNNSSNERLYIGLLSYFYIYSPFGSFQFRFFTS